MRRPFFIGIAVTVAAIAVVFSVGNNHIAVENKNQDQVSSENRPDASLHDLGLLTGAPCQHPRRRPFAVMLSSDPEPRPLAGIAAADVVVEMSVVTGSITRSMALFQCEDPEVIGSVRSARHDFIPIAAAFDAIFAHWGGSVLALDQLNNSVIDNIDALINIGGAYWENLNDYRRPHAGFTSLTNLQGAADRLGYRQETDVQPFLFDARDDRGTPGSVIIGYPGVFDVVFLYDPETKRYTRYRDERLEIDANTGVAASVSNVVVLRASSRQVLGDYNDVDLDGSGPLALYRNGEEMLGWWEKDAEPLDAPLQFFDENGAALSLEPGRTWIAIVEPYQRVEWTEDSILQ